MLIAAKRIYNIRGTAIQNYYRKKDNPKDLLGDLSAVRMEPLRRVPSVFTVNMSTNAEVSRGHGP
jgi:hypothetical protein